MATPHLDLPLPRPLPFHIGQRRLIATETVEDLVRNSVATLEPKPRSAA